MYLKGLELQGFKSFPDRIKLDFNKGITGVVGPNGSGKSNICDAVRWVLGEKSAKTLRGAKMEDVIFNGTAEKKPMGFAEVTLIMDNSDRVLNLDYSEVSVTRKVYRSGEGEYLINGHKCRQRDILELFMDTGVGKEGYSIIGQGRIDEILSNKSEDRRSLFEEAAGIVKYKARCNETQSNLENTQANLVRVKDIIAEIETQIGPLERQAEKAKKYLVLYEDLKKYQISIFVEDADRYEAEIGQFNGQIAQLKADIDNSRTEQERLEGEKNKYRSRLNAVNEEMETKAALLADKRAEAEKRQGDVRLCNNDIEHIKNNINTSRKAIEENKAKITDYENRIKGYNAALNSKKIELSAKTDEYSSIRSRVEAVSTSLTESQDKLNDYNDKLLDSLNQRTALTNSLTALNTILNQHEETEKNSDIAISSYDGRIQQAEAALSVQEMEAEGIELEIETINKNVAALNGERERVIKLKRERDSRGQAVLKEISEKNSRLRVLTEFKNDYEGYFGGVKAILKQRDDKAKGFEGIHGAVGEVITMPKELETAIEIALGGAVQNIIANTEEDVKSAIGFLKEKRLGRATFLPMTAVKGRSIGSDRFKIVNSKGVIGIAKELVNYEDKYEGIMSSLLDRVIVVDNIDNGIALARDTKYAYKIVTLEGDLFNAGGSMTGGSNNKKSAGIFSRTREITDLQTALEALQKERVRLEEELNTINSRMTDIEESLKEANEELGELAIGQNEHRLNIEHIKNEIETLKKDKADHISRMEELSKSLEDTKIKAKATEESLNMLNREIDEIKAGIDKFNESLKVHEKSKNDDNEKMVLLNGEINRIKGEYTSVERDIERARANIAELSDRNAVLLQTIDQSLGTITEKEASVEGLNSEVERIERECADLEEGQKALSEEKAKATGLADEYERRIRSIMQSISGLETERTRITGKREQTEQKSKELFDRMFETYEITYVAAKAFPPIDLKYEAKKREESRLKGEIKALGSVNPSAVEEYEALKERYETYVSQQGDIVETEGKLKAIIEQLQKQMEEQFKEQFKLIRENFARVFAEMFGGGKANLKLADENDVLNCGIEIEAQPPGKALQNMMLLSGGEKAMTAISLLFAILEMKPTPFCILDEIEAALDEANVVRFAEYLRNFTDTTQFIVVTHRPGTREVADMLYGVTQLKGVSQLFSTNIDEILKELEENGNI